MTPLRLLLILGIFFLCPGTLQAQFNNDRLVELTGVIMSSDSLRYLPYVTISVINKNQGTMSSERGVFSMVAEKGDTLDFTCVGFRKKRYIVPNDVPSNRLSVIQLMSQDTFYLATTIIRPQLSAEEFERAFRTWDIPDDKYETARKNTEYQTMRMLAFMMPRDGRENQQVYQNLQVQRSYWAGQQPPMTVFSPLAWAEFFKAWKRGDFKRKR
ncbi:MAG: carboxypeptidase-like regulatory domain-containing protein [Chitinophagaceae bacterium]|nr:carboxypeptidase-like regulatory domain-containing protein [Chitinophagaceae bacterium]